MKHCIPFLCAFTFLNNSFQSLVSGDREKEIEQAVTNLFGHSTTRSRHGSLGNAAATKLGLNKAKRLRSFNFTSKHSGHNTLSPHSSPRNSIDTQVGLLESLSLSNSPTTKRKSSPHTLSDTYKRASIVSNKSDPSIKETMGTLLEETLKTILINPTEAKKYAGLRLCILLAKKSTRSLHKHTDLALNNLLDVICWHFIQIHWTKDSKELKNYNLLPII